MVHELLTPDDHRVALLRLLASEIDAAPAHYLDELAERFGRARWLGSRAALCRAIVEINQAQLHRAADDLRELALAIEWSAA